MTEIMTMVRSSLTSPLGRRLRVVDGKFKGIDIDAIIDALIEMQVLGEIEGFDAEDAHDNGHGIIRIAA